MATRIHLRDGDESWQADVSGGRVTLGEGGPAFELRELADSHWQVSLSGPAAAGGPVDACAAASGDVVWVWLDGDLFDIQVGQAGDEPRTRAKGREGLSAPMPATVVRVAVQPGARVTRGDTLIVLEAMKMELPIRAPQDGTVGAIHCREGELVQPGVVLVDFT